LNTAGGIMPHASAPELPTANLNDLLLSRWLEWDAVVTRWMDTNGTLVDLYDRSRREAGHDSNITLSTIGGYLIALTNMYEQTGNEYYLAKLRVIVDSINSSSWFYRTVDVGTIFYTPTYYYDDAEQEINCMIVGWVGYTSMKLYLWTGNTNYLSLAKRIASESYDKLTAVNNSTDLAWSARYYSTRTVEQAKISVNGFSMFIPFYALYGQHVNSTFTTLIPRMLHWQQRAQLPSGGFRVSIGTGIEDAYHTALMLCEWLRAYAVAPSQFTSYTTNITNALAWLEERNYDWNYYNIVIVSALEQGIKRSFTVNATKLQTRAYIELQLLNYTLYGQHEALNQRAVGWRWAENGLGNLFGAYPFTYPDFDTRQIETLLTDAPPGDGVQQAASSIVNLNTLMFERWEQWDALLTRWMDTNGTLVDLYDRSRREAGHASNATLSTIGGYLVALTNMYEQTSDPYYLAKLRCFVDKFISEGWFYRDGTGGVGTIFYPPLYYYDGDEQDFSPIAVGWIGYVALKLHLWTAEASYLELATRIASESYDKLTAVNNSTDLAWSCAYYSVRTAAQAMLGVNRNGMLVPFYALYGKNVNSTFTAAIPRMLHWQQRAQMPSGGFRYSIGTGSEDAFYTSMMMVEWLKGYAIDPTPFTSYVTNITNTLAWLQNRDYSWNYYNIAVAAALEAGLKNTFSVVNVTRLQTRTYVVLQLLNYTLFGQYGALNQRALGWRWAQFGLGSLFSIYPLTQPNFDTSVSETLLSNSLSGNDRLLSTKLSIGSMMYSLRNTADFWGIEDFVPGSLANPFFTVFGRNQGSTPTQTCTNATYYINSTWAYGSGNTLKTYIYATGLIMHDLTGTRNLTLFGLQTTCCWKVWTSNGSVYDIKDLVGTGRILSNAIMLQHDTSPRVLIYYYTPNTTWDIVSSNGYQALQTTLTNARVLEASFYCNDAEVVTPWYIFSAMREYENHLTDTMPLSFEEMVIAYKQVKEKYGELQWHSADWGSTYNSMVNPADPSEPRLIMHNKPQKVNMVAWAFGNDKLVFQINASAGIMSTTKVYVGDRGQPANVTGATSWSYDDETKIVTVDVLHESVQEISLDWGEHTPPLTTASLIGVGGRNGWFVSEVRVTLTATDEGSGVDRMEYSFDNSTWVAYADPFSIDVEGYVTVYFRSIDRDGNIESVKYVAAKIDRTEPTGSVVINYGHAYVALTSVELTVSAADSLSGIDLVRFGQDDTWTDWEPCTASRIWALTSGDGVKHVYVQFMDNAGLTSQIYHDTIILDATKPVADAGLDRTIDEDTATTFDASASYDENPIVSYVWTFADATTTEAFEGPIVAYTFDMPGVYVVTLNVTDAAGNWATDTIAATVLDVTKPVAYAGENQTVKAGTAAAFDASGSTDNVGIISYEWDFGDGSTGVGRTATHVFANPGIHTVILTVYDAAGNVATHSITVTVQPQDIPAEPPWWSGVTSVWIIGAAIAVTGIAVATILLRKRKTTRKN
jgi:PKD repeat protein